MNISTTMPVVFNDSFIDYQFFCITSHLNNNRKPRGCYIFYRFSSVRVCQVLDFQTAPDGTLSLQTE